eukprot:1227462-Rhodomonas_salina.3
MDVTGTADPTRCNPYGCPCPLLRVHYAMSGTDVLGCAARFLYPKLADGSRLPEAGLSPPSPLRARCAKSGTGTA